MKKIALIGSTGSIGVQVLNAVRRHPNSFKIVALSAYSLSKTFLQQIKEFSPEVYAAASEDKAKALSIAAYKDADLIFNAVSGKICRKDVRQFLLEQFLILKAIFFIKIKGRKIIGRRFSTAYKLKASILL